MDSFFLFFFFRFSLYGLDLFQYRLILEIIDVGKSWVAPLDRESAHKRSSTEM
jgi:hypothetical protein